MANKVPLGSSWLSLKMHLKQHRQILTTINALGSVLLQYSIDIMGEIDRYSDTHFSKMRLQTKSSYESKKSTSSKNSIKSKQERKVKKIVSMTNIVAAKNDLKADYESRVESDVVKSILKSTRSSPVLETAATAIPVLAITTVGCHKEEESGALTL